MKGEEEEEIRAHRPGIAGKARHPGVVRGRTLTSAPSPAMGLPLRVTRGRPTHVPRPDSKRGRQVPVSMFRIAAVLTAIVLAGCAPRPDTTGAPADQSQIPMRYEGLPDGELFIPAVPARYLTDENRRTEVAYNGPEPPGTVVVDIYARKLYLVEEGGRATRYGIAVGKEGTSFRGMGYIGRRAKWPGWTPTANMLASDPEKYGEYAGGVPGGLDNPLGARALYLYRNGKDTLFRIHGTIDPAAIGRATSAGCIRVFNQDALELFERVDSHAAVKVRTRAESEALEGRYMDDAWGRAVPETPEALEQKARDNERIAAYERRQAEEAARVARERLQNCERNGISEAECRTELAAGLI